jgi:hypothetical protein
MYLNFDEIINQTVPIFDKNICINKILFDEYKLLKKLGFNVKYFIISNSSNIDVVNAYKCIENNEIDKIENEKILKFVLMNK